MPVEALFSEGHFDCLLIMNAKIAYYMNNANFAMQFISAIKFVWRIQVFNATG
jgi:hypothetical protein